MKKFSIDKVDFKEYSDIHDLELIQIDDLNLYKKEIETLINFFNEEYKWDGMFNIIDVKNRLINNHILFLLKFKKDYIGYVWFKKLDDNICFGYNLYVTKKIERPAYAPKWFYNKASKQMLDKYNTIKVEIEDWNKVVFDLVESIGYKEMNI